MKKRLLKPIKNRAIVWQHLNLNVTEPLNFTNDVLSINKDNLDVWNGYGDEISALGDQVQTIQGQQNTNTNKLSELNEWAANVEITHNISIKDNNLHIEETKLDHPNTYDLDLSQLPIIKEHTQQIQDNHNDINDTIMKVETNTQNINDIINQLRDSNIINYVGEYQAGTTYKLGQVVSYQNKMYLCKVETTTNEPTNNNDWDLLSAPEIDLTNYYTKQQIDIAQQAQDRNITNNTNSINDLMTTKQDTLTAGNNISISNNTISAVLPSINITTNETLIPNYKVNNKQVYAKYVEYTNTGTFNYTIVSGVDCFISNGISILANNKETYANITGGMVINSFSADYAFKVYLDGSGNIKIYSNRISERLTFKGIVYYTKK